MSVVVVEHRAACTRSSVDHLHETGDLHQRIERMIPLRYEKIEELLTSPV